MMTGTKREERDEEILQAWMAGDTQAVIAACMGMSQPNVHRILAVAGFVDDPAVRRERRDAAVRLFNSGLSASATARCLGVASPTVLKWVRRAESKGVVVRAFASKTQDACAKRQERILALRERGAKLREIAEWEGISSAGVSRILKRSGAPARHRFGRPASTFACGGREDAGVGA